MPSPRTTEPPPGTREQACFPCERFPSQVEQLIRYQASFIVNSKADDEEGAKAAVERMLNDPDVALPLAKAYWPAIALAGQNQAIPTTFLSPELIRSAIILGAEVLDASSPGVQTLIDEARAAGVDLPRWPVQLDMDVVVASLKWNAQALFTSGTSSAGSPALSPSGPVSAASASSASGADGSSGGNAAAPPSGARRASLLEAAGFDDAGKAGVGAMVGAAAAAAATGGGGGGSGGGLATLWDGGWASLMLTRARLAGGGVPWKRTQRQPRFQQLAPAAAAASSPAAARSLQQAAAPPPPPPPPVPADAAAAAEGCRVDPTVLLAPFWNVSQAVASWNRGEPAPAPERGKSSPCRSRSLAPRAEVPRSRHPPQRRSNLRTRGLPCACVARACRRGGGARQRQRRGEAHAGAGRRHGPAELEPARVRVAAAGGRRRPARRRECARLWRSSGRHCSDAMRGKCVP